MSEMGSCWILVTAVAIAVVAAVGFHQRVSFRGKCLFTVVDTSFSPLQRRGGWLRAGLLTMHRLAISEKGAELKD